MVVKKSPRTIPEGKSQENFNLPTALQEKVRDLAHAEGVNKSEIYTAAVEKYIELYEKKNGKIKPRPKGKGLVL